ncbi:MAG: nuclear transport factor 2 family protein [Deltaproteobacteria bacterium]|nr:nuclear transport factor 2 family protein [Deltaproteobacteria bacterium]MBW2448628.1 nuclear transport factor 2 family protein [Deltaproteobacteria bacterium]
MASDERAIEGLLYAYAERIDLGDFEGVADLFAHGLIAPFPGASAEQRVEGRDAVLALYRGTTRLYEDGTPHTKHITSNVIVDVEGERASARSYYTVLQQVGELPLQPIISGRYHDRFHRIDGAWWFDARVIHVDLVGDLSRHLLIDLG